MSDVDLTNECEICGEENPKTLEEHHVVPRRYGGSDRPENIVKLCSNCHAAVERIWDDDFYDRLEQVTNDLEVNAVDKDEKLGYVVDQGVTSDRRLPDTSPHVRIEIVSADDPVVEEIVDANIDEDTIVTLYACGYCDRVFKPFNQSHLATHLQRRHGVSDPYEDNSYTDDYLLESSGTQYRLSEALVQQKHQPDESDETNETVERIASILHSSSIETEGEPLAYADLDVDDARRLIEGVLGTREIDEAERRVAVWNEWRNKLYGDADD